MYYGYTAMNGNERATPENFIPRLVDRDITDLSTLTDIYTFLKSGSCQHTNQLKCGFSSLITCVDCGLYNSELPAYEEKLASLKKFARGTFLDFKVAKGKYTYILSQFMSSPPINIACEMILDTFKISPSAYEEHNVRVGNFSIQPHTCDEIDCNDGAFYRHTTLWKINFTLHTLDNYENIYCKEDPIFKTLFHRRLRELEERDKRNKG